MEIHQEIFKLLGIDLDIEKERSSGKAALADQNQLQAAQKNGYDFSVFIPGQISREEIIKKVQAYLSNSILGAINFYTQDYLYSKAALKPLRPKNLYQILLKSQKEVSAAHPQTAGKSFDQCQEILAQTNKTDPILNLKGLTLEEYLIAQVNLFNQKRDWFEAATTSWLLEEQINTVQNPNSCLRAYFRVNAIGVGACPVKSFRPKRGAR
ncbi:MAG: hypothetical protein AAB785_02105, partial [Patescibacteria group bacterium]